MADFKIKLNTELNSEKAESQLKELQNKADKKPMKIKTQLDLKTFDSQVSALKKSLNNAFKLDKNQMSNLKEMKTLIQEINKLSKQAQKSIFGSVSGSNTKNEVSNVKNLVKEYDKLHAKQKSIEQQMSKTSNKQSYAVLSQELAKARNEAEKVGFALDKIGAVKGNSNITKSLADTFQSVNKQIDSTETKINKLLKNKNLGSEQSNSLVQLKNNLEDLRNINLDSIIDAEKPYAEMSKLVKGVQELKTNFNNLNIDIKFNDKLVKAESSIDGLISKFKTLSKSGFSDKGEITNTINELERLKTSLNGIDINSSGATSQLKEIESSIKECSNAYEQLNNESRNNKLQFNFDVKLNKTISDLQLLRDKCEQLGSGVDEVNRLENELQQLGNVDLDKASSELTRICSEMTTLGKTINSSSIVKGATKGFFSDLYQTMTTFSLGNILADQIQQGVYAIKDTIINLDNAFRNLMKVAPTDFQGTTQQLDELRDKAISAGQEVAKSSVDIIESTANALQSGFKTIDESLQYAKESAKFSNVSDMSQEDTDKALRSILSSYGGVENSLKGVRTEIQGASSDYSMLNQVMDAANYVGNNYSTSTQSVAEGLQNAGSSLKTMGASVTDGMAYFVAIDEIMQNAGKSSNGLKAIAQNMTGITVSAKDGSLKLNKSALALKEYANIDIQKPSGELRDMGDVLDELGGKWESLNKTQKQALMVAIGGKQRSSQFSALMDNWETVKQIQQEIASGAAIGSADAENAKFIDSIEGRIVKLQEELKKLVTTTISTDMFKGAVSGLTSFVSGLNSVIGALDKLGISTPVVASSLAGIIMAVKGLGTGNGVPNILDGLVSGFNLLKGSSNGAGKQLNVIKEVTEDVVEGMDNATVGIGGFASGLSKTGAKSLVASLGVSALNVGIMALAGVGISLAIKGIDNFVNRSEKLAEASRNRQAEIKGEIDTTKQQISSLDEIAEEYDKLANKTNKSKEELKRFNELKQEVATISPELVMGYDENNNPILAINGSLEQTIALKKEILALNQQILAEEQKQEVEANRDKAERLWENQGYTKDKYDGGSDIAGNAQKDAFDTVLYSKDVKSYKKSLEDKKTAYNEYINEMSKARSEYNEIELKAQQSAITELNSSLSDKKLNDKTIQNINSVVGSFNWGQLSASETQQVQQGFDNLNNSFSKFDTQGFQTKVNNLSRDFEAGSISKEQYEKGISSLADTLIKAGVDVEKSTLIEALKQFPPELREIDYAMAGVLKNVGLKLSDLGSNVKADMLFNQMTNMSTLTNKFANSIETTGTISVNLIPEIGSDIYESLPTQIQGAIDTVMADGSVSEQEAEILMKLMTSWEQDGEITSDELIELKELDGDVITSEIQAKLDADVSDDYRKYVINDTKEGNSLNNTITSKFKAEGQDEYTQAYEKAGVEPGSKEGKKIKNEIDAEFEQVGFETSQNVVDIMDSLGLSTGKEQSNFLSTIEAQIKSGNMNLSDLKDSQTILDWLYAHPEVTSKYKIDVLGKESVDAVEKSLNGLDLGKEEKKSIIMDIQEGDLNGLEESINKIPEEKRSEVIMEIGQALTSIGTVDAITLRDKIAKIFGVDLSKGTVDSADAYKKNTTKNANITATDNSKGTVDSADSHKKSMGKLITITALDLATKVIDGVNVSPVTKVISVVAQKVGDAWNWLTGGRSGGGRSRSGASSWSIGNPSNVPNTPQEKSIPTTMSTGVSDSPTNINDTPSTPNSVNPSNQVSSRSVGSFGSVLTNPTQSTKISKSYKNVLNMIKYGINLFQELENRISRTANQLDLLSIKMENAVGTKKISYLKQQNALYKEQAKLQKTLFKSLYSEKQSVQKKLKKSGFTINKQGNLTNYEERLLKLEKEAERTEKASSDYKGKNKKTKNRLEKNAESAKKKLDEAKSLTEEYLKLQYKELPAAEQEWYKLQNAIKETNDEIERLKFEDKIKPFINDINESAFKIDRLNSLLDRAKTSADNSEGETKLKYLKKQVDYNNQLIKQNNILADKTKGERKQYRNKLRDYGFKFDKNGEFTNYDTIMDKYANSSDYDKIKEWTDEYLNLGNEMRDSLEALQDLQYSSKELNNEIKKLELEEKLFSFNTAIDVSNSKIQKLQNNLDIISIKMEHAYGTDKLKLIKEQIKLYEQLEKEQKKSLENMKKEESTLKKELQKNGFKFNSSGDITNMESALSKLKNSSAYEYVSSVLEQWKDLHENEIPDAIESIEDYDKAIKDSLKNQLDITKDIEDKISDMLKKQIEDRKEAIRKETDTIKDELEKRKKAYQDERKEAEYKNEYAEKTDEISKLEKELANAKKDTSLGNKKRIAELEKQLAEAKKDLDKFVQDKIDSDIEQGYDDAIQSAEDEGNAKIEELEKIWTDSKIAEVIKNALNTGIKMFHLHSDM